MTFIKEFIAEYGTQMLFAVVTALAGYVGIAAKKLFEKYVTDQTAKEVVKISVQAVEQLFKELHGEEKLEKALMYASDMLKTRGITVSAVELRLLVEAAVGEFNGAFKKETEALPIEPTVPAVSDVTEPTE